MPYATLSDFQPQRRSIPRGYIQRLGQAPVQTKMIANSATQDWNSIPVLLPEQPFPKDTMDWYYYGELAMEDAGAKMAASIGSERCPYWLGALASYRPERGLGKAGFVNFRDFKADFTALFYHLAEIDPNTPAGIVTPARLAAIRKVQEVYFAGLKKVQVWSREDIVQQKAVLDKTWWFNTQPWMKACRCVSPYPWTGPWISWMVGYMAKLGPENAAFNFPEPPRPPIGADAEYNAYIQVMSRAFGIGFVPEPAANDPRYAVYKNAIYIVTHPPIGFFGMIGRFFQRFASIIITVVGAILSPFTGGASVLVATLINSIKTTVAVVSAAKAAKAAAAADAAALKAESDKQMAGVVAQVDKFYADNPQWFLQHGMTPEKWKTLNIDQKIEFITAGAEGRLPAGSEPVNLSAEDQEKLFTDQALAAQKAGLKPESVLPMEVGGTVRAPAGQVPPPASTASPMTYDVVVEGKTVGTYPSAAAANQAALDNTNRGDRFEVIAGGQSTGVKVQTAAGPIAIPPGQEDQVMAVSKDKMLDVVKKAETDAMQQGTKSSFPWWLVLAAGGAVVAARG